ncbi:MAG: peptide chain release factor aRF-1 [Candidatus Woesearchaeota archaeon]|nr:peptide chain release factor aRF-1 [Candidatus Woesearchaeota archaeon]
MPVKGQMEKIDAATKHKLKQFIKQLEQYRGRGTELVSVYVPDGYSLDMIIGQLQDEQGTATNIKSKQTRTNVSDALERMIQHLRTIKRTPPNGLAVFAGNVAEKEGQSDVQVWSVPMPLPSAQRLYRCDKEFILHPIREIVEHENVYGLVVFDRRDAMLGLLQGKKIVPLVQTHSEVPGKHKSGGQSAVRFARLREGATIEHFKKIADYMKDQFLPMGADLKGIIIGGPGITVNMFMQHDYVTGDVKKKILGTKDLSYTGEFGLQELLEKSEDLLASEEVAQEKKLMQKFFYELSKDTGKAAYGKDDVIQAIEYGAADTVLLSEKLHDDVIEDMEQRADTTGSKTQIISDQTREGVQLKEMGGIAAILRYSLG